MSFFGSNGLKREHFPELRARFDAIIRNAGKDPKDYDDYFRKEIEHIATLMMDFPTEEAFKKAIALVETSAGFELKRKDIVRGLLEGSI